MRFRSTFKCATSDFTGISKSSSIKKAGLRPVGKVLSLNLSLVFQLLHSVLKCCPTERYIKTVIIPGNCVLKRSSGESEIHFILNFCNLRWKMTTSGALIENGKKVLEFVAIQRKDNQEWAIPGVSITLLVLMSV